MAAIYMDLKIKIIGGRSAGQEVAITRPEFLIGRADECQLRPKSETVSRRHAAIELHDSKVLIRDLGSRTGTFVNGKLVAPQNDVELANGDTVKIGPIEFETLIKFTVGGKKKPKVENVADVASRTAAAPEEVDVTQWLTANDEDTAITETIEGGSFGNVVSAADLFGGGPNDAKPSDSSVKKSDSNPDQLASDMIKNYLRRK